ncbi:riboflavin biosynthesis protein [Bacillus freudenreichii]|nr:riboflavin biosynthesis protein [Bacillus freudenreichii]
MDIHTSGSVNLAASVLTIGAFDGVHKGHQKLLAKTKERARRRGVPFVVYTFDPPPKVYFGRGQLLTTLEEKLYRLERIGADQVIVGRFDEDYMKKDMLEFIEELRDVNPLEIWEGPNFRFGKGRKGTLDVLGQHFNLGVLHPVECPDNEMISSTRIRQLIEAGEYSKAEQLLGWDLASPAAFQNLELARA